MRVTMAAMATVDGAGWDFADTLRHKMAEQGYTIEQLGAAAGVAPRTIQGWLSEGRRPRDIPWARVVNVLGPLDDDPDVGTPAPPSRAEVVKALKAAERAIRRARDVLDQLGD